MGGWGEEKRAEEIKVMIEGGTHKAEEVLGVLWVRVMTCA